MVLLATVISAQEADSEYAKNWYNLDLAADNYPGMSVEKAYDFLKGKTSKKVVVAVIDSGIDGEHEDLAPIMWTNPGETAGNGIDDDRNGYVDDVHGWNYIGGSDGENINYENLEIVRLYNKLNAKYNNRNRDGLSKKERAEYDKYIEYKEEIEKKREELSTQANFFSSTMEAVNMLVQAIGKEPADITNEDITNYKGDEKITTIAAQIQSFLARFDSFGALYEELEGGNEYFTGSYGKNWNPEFDARSIVGDDPSDLSDRNYGNNDIQGPDAGHGTHVAGIIAGVRGNNIGNDGVANNVSIMSVRAVPNGDERDKDVANAIRYAVDNGAQVINMSFGKGQSPYKDAVDDAVRYARKRGVVLVHAAGNDGKLLTLENNFPNDTYEKRGFFGPKGADNWIEVGASTRYNDEKLPASFSNYDNQLVDVFAPGQEIYSSTPDNNYAVYQGTSMASPMVAGVAAMLFSYFPDLSAEQVKEIIMASTVPFQSVVTVPGEESTGNFKDLSVTGGVVNAYNAVKIAAGTKGKNKKGGTRDASLMMAN